VDEVLFKEGKLVDPDDPDETTSVLVKIDQKRFLRSKQLAEANERRGEANVARTEAKLALARDQASRAERLSERQAISQEELIRWGQELKVAEAERAAAEAELGVARSARELAERDLEMSIVRPVAEGDYVKDETIIATIADISKVRLATWIPELAATRVRVGDKLEFELGALPQRKFEGVIFYISTVADPQSHMFECKADVVSPVPEMRPGLFARVRIPTGKHQDACVIPEESVRASERGFVAFVPERRSDSQGKPQWIASARRLDIGFRSPGFVEILAGVGPGERVVTRGSEALEDGTPIEFPQEESKTEATAETELKKNGKI
jgi:RND family efflux transporter MFP subunit